MVFHFPRFRVGFGLVVTTFVFLGCSGAGESAEEAPGDASDTGTPASNPAPLVQLLTRGEILFGMFSGPKTPEQGAQMGRNRELAFVFYSLESGPFDIPTMADYMAGIGEGSAPEPPHPLILRVPPVRDGVARAEANVAQALAAGVAGVVFPHVESADDAAAAVAAMGPESWPGNPEGTLLNMLIVEDRAGVERLDEIAATPGVGVIFAGPGDLRRAYEGDMAAVEDAIQAVLQACKAHDVPCGITAGPEDIGDRIGQGFRVFIVSDPAAVSVGRGAAESVL